MNETARSKNVWLWLTIPIAASRRDSGAGLYSCCVAPRAGAWGPGIKSLWKGERGLKA